MTLRYWAPCPPAHWPIETVYSHRQIAVEASKILFFIQNADSGIVNFMVFCRYLSGSLPLFCRSLYGTLCRVLPDKSWCAWPNQKYFLQNAWPWLTEWGLTVSKIFIPHRTISLYLKLYTKVRIQSTWTEYADRVRGQREQLTSRLDMTLHPVDFSQKIFLLRVPVVGLHFVLLQWEIIISVVVCMYNRMVAAYRTDKLL